MRLLLATGIFPPEIGGSATYAALLLDELARRGVDATVVTYGASERQGVACVSRRWPKGIRHLLYFLTVFRLAKKHDAVLSADASFGAGFVSAAAARMADKKFFVRVTGDYAWEQGVQRFGVKELLDDFQKRRHGFLVETLRFFQRKTVAWAERVIAPSEYLRNIVLGWGVTAEKIAVIYNSFETPVLSKSKEAVRQALGITRRLIVSAGRLVPWKGFGTLIALWAELKKTFPDWTFVIIGVGPEERRLRAQNEALGAGVIFTGVLPHRALLRYLAAADIFVLNTAYEGFSHQLLEAMAMEAAVVTTRVGGNPEIITNGETGVLAAYNDREAFERALTELCGDAAKRTHLAERAKASLARFSKERLIDETVRILSG